MNKTAATAALDNRTDAELKAIAKARLTRPGVIVASTTHGLVRIAAANGKSHNGKVIRAVNSHDKIVRVAIDSLIPATATEQKKYRAAFKRNAAIRAVRETSKQDRTAEDFNPYKADLAKGKKASLLKQGDLPTIKAKMPISKASVKPKAEIINLTAKKPEPWKWPKAADMEGKTGVPKAPSVINVLNRLGHDISVRQDITSLMHMTPEALDSIISRWRKEDGPKVINAHRKSLLKTNPSSELVFAILHQASRLDDDTDYGYADKRAMYMELAKGINANTLAAALDTIPLPNRSLTFDYNTPTSNSKGINPMLVLNPEFGEKILNMVSSRTNTDNARISAMWALMSNGPQVLVNAVQRGRISKYAVNEFRAFDACISGKKPIYSTFTQLSKLTTDMCIAKAVLWPEDALRALAINPATSFVSIYGDVHEENLSLFWFPTGDEGAGKSVYQRAFGDTPIRYFELLLIVALGGFIYKHAIRNGRESLSGAEMKMLRGILSKMPNAKDVNFHNATARHVLGLAFRHEYMKEMVLHLAVMWKGFADVAMSDETVKWFIETIQIMRGKLPDNIMSRINNRRHRQDVLWRAQSCLSVIQNSDYFMTLNEPPRRDLEVAAALRKWVRVGLDVENVKVTKNSDAHHYFELKAVNSGKVSEDMLTMLKELACQDVPCFAMKFDSYDLVVLRSLLTHARDDFYLHLYRLNPLHMWATEYPATSIKRSSAVRTKIMAMLPDWLVRAIRDERPAPASKIAAIEEDGEDDE